MRRLGVRETGEEEEREEIAARLRASEAALARLEELASEPWMHQGALSHTRDRYRLRTRHLRGHADGVLETPIDRKSTRLNSSHVATSYAGFCLKKKKQSHAACS